MASFWLIKKLLIVVLVCKLVVAFSVEPKYTKFQFEEQLLEKLIRLEIYFENMQKQQTLFINNALESINQTKQEMDKSNTNLISGALNLINQTKQEMDKSNTNLISDALNLINQTKQEMDKSNTNLISDALNLINQTKQEMDKEITNLIDTKSEIKNIKAEYDGLTGQINQLKTDISEIKSKDENKVVFNAYRTSAQTVSQNDPVIFDQVHQNEGNGYDVSTGIFTAPVSGIYQFNGHLCARKGGDLDYAILVNNYPILNGEFRAASDSNDFKCTSFGAAYVVSKGEAVKVSGFTTPLDAGGNDYHSFSGALIKEV